MFKEGEFTNKADDFSFGLVLYEILVGSAVFPSSEYRLEVMKRILNGDMPEIPAKCGNSCKILSLAAGRQIQKIVPHLMKYSNNFRAAILRLCKMLILRSSCLMCGHHCLGRRKLAIPKWNMISALSLNRMNQSVPLD
jgi:hypothetical protein